MKLLIAPQQIRKSALLLVVSALVTVMVAPNLNLVPTRYEEGDIITQDIVIKDTLILEDERSTAARREQAVAAVLPIFDFDLRLRNRTYDAVRTAFKEMRGELAGLRKARAELLARIRRNSLERITARSKLEAAIRALPVLRRAKTEIIREIGLLSDLPNPDADQRLQSEKRRFDLFAIEAQLTAGEQASGQLKAQAARVEEEGDVLRKELEAAYVSEEQTLLKMKDRFDEKLAIATTLAEFTVLRQAGFNEELEKKIISLLIPVLGQKIVSTPESLPSGQEAIQMQLLDSNKLERFEALGSVVDVQHVRSQITKNAEALQFSADGAAQRETVTALAQKLVQPNLTENKGATKNQKVEIARNLSPVYFNLKTGDVVARAGDVATAQQVEYIRALYAYNLKNPKWPQLLGTFLIVLLALGLLGQVILFRERETGVSFSRMLLMAILVMAALFFAQVILAVVPALTTLYDFFPASAYSYLIPASLTSMLAGILFGFEIAIFLGLATSLFLAILLGNSLPFFIFAMMGSFVAALPMRHYDTRYALWQQGLRISAINIPVLLVLTLLDQNKVSWALAYELGAGFVNGLGVAFLVSTSLPLIERLFDITTNMRLLELSNMNHPALKELAVRAPGTYHHSIVVGNLSESAAGGIRANPLLVRVASYYHDLGKMLCPLYFVENQMQSNYHDDLPAKTSTRIIINHVKDGLELARRYRLGRTITEIVAQHHGTSLVRYFFHKAEEERVETEDIPREMEYRYPGPKPQSKEAGLVMVADVTEAATRSLEEPSPESISKMVQKLSTTIYMDGQLDESGLTFNDLNFIEKTFTKMLMSIHHHRITYPDLNIAPRADGEEELDADAAPRDDPPVVEGRRATSRG